MSKSKHPMQRLHIDNEGTVRFQRNEIVRFLPDKGGYDLERLFGMKFSEEDWTQFSQLIGYSVCGYGELSYVSSRSIRQADRRAQKLLDDKRG